LIAYQLITNQGDRECNEDSATCIETDGNLCFIVADGLGGHGKGDIASQKVVESFKWEFNTVPENNKNFLINAFTNAQNEIRTLQKTQGSRFQMMTTAVCLSISNGKCQWGHIGDSRLYAFCKNKVKFRTLDHSVPQMLAISGQIKDKHIARHPDRNRLLRAIGVEWDSPRYELSEELPLYDFEAFLLCTDGFWEHIAQRKMCSFLKKSSTPDEWINFMATEVVKNARGQDMDNYTAIAVFVRN